MKKSKLFTINLKYKRIAKMSQDVAVKLKITNLDIEEEVKVFGGSA